MTENDRDTAFLKEMLKYGPRGETAAHQQNLHKAEREERCIRCALRRVFQLTAVAGLGFLATGYSLPHISAEYLDPLARIFFLLTVTAGVSAILFACMRQIAVGQLNVEREKCRVLIKRQLESGLPAPTLTHWKAEPAQVAVAAEEQPGGSESDSNFKYLPFPEPVTKTRMLRSKILLANVSRAAAS